MMMMMMDASMKLLILSFFPHPNYYPKKPFNKSKFGLSMLSIFRRGSRGVRWGGRPPLGRRDPRRRRGFLRLKGRKKGHWCLLNGCSTPFKHNMAMNILKSCKFVFAYVKNRSSPSHIRSSIPWRPPLAEILDPRLIFVRSSDIWCKPVRRHVWRCTSEPEKDKSVFGVASISRLSRFRDNELETHVRMCSHPPPTFVTLVTIGSFLATHQI